MNWSKDNIKELFTLFLELFIVVVILPFYLLFNKFKKIKKDE